MLLNTFGKRLRVLRVEKEMSQIQLRDAMVANETPVGETYISELERTKRMPTLEIAAGFARVLDVSLDYLGLLIDEAKSYRRETPAPYYSEEADEMAQLVDSLHPAQRGQLLDVARHMASPGVQRRHLITQMREMLDSVEEELGGDARGRVERNLRRKWLPVDFDS